MQNIYLKLDIVERFDNMEQISQYYKDLVSVKRVNDFKKRLSQKISTQRLIQNSDHIGNY